MPIGRLVTLLLLVALLTNSGPAGADDRDRRDRRDPYRSLKLPRERATRLRVLQSRVDRDNRKLKDRLKDRRDDLADLYRSYDYDSSRCWKLRREIREVQNRMLELHHQFQLELRAILTKAEFERLQRELRAARRRRNDD